jgi:hypothetical protein
MAAISPRPCAADARDHGIGLSKSPVTARPRMSASGPCACPRNIPMNVHIMSAFDPANVRQAVQDFTPCRPQKHQELLSAKDVIGELRQKRASYRAIAELLNQHCLVTSKTAVANFCHDILGETVRPHRRTARRRPNSVPTQPLASRDRDSAPVLNDGTENTTNLSRARGPRIAQVRMIKPQNT